jgi:hypothetical protein
VTLSSMPMEDIYNMFPTKKTEVSTLASTCTLVWFLFSIRCQQKRQMFHGGHICSSLPSCLLFHVWLRYIYSTTLITVDVMLGVSTSDPQPPTSFHPSQLMEVKIFCRRPKRQQDLGHMEHQSQCKGTNKVGIQ